MIRRLGTLATALAILAMLALAYLAYRPDSGIDVRTVRPGGAPRDVRVRVAKPGRREAVAASRSGADGSVRFRLEAGRYLVKGGGRPVHRNIAVVVRDGFSRVTVRYR